MASYTCEQLILQMPMLRMACGVTDWCFSFLQGRNKELRLRIEWMRFLSEIVSNLSDFDNALLIDRVYTRQ